MHSYAALLRGISPSGVNMTNDKLRGVFTELGFAGVGSVLASGNIVFRSTEGDVPALERRLEQALNRTLGITPCTIIRELSQLRALVDSDPFPGLTHGRGTYLTATFLQDDPGAPVPATGQPDRFTLVVGYHPGARVVLAVTDNTDAGRTPDFMLWLEQSYGRHITTRSWLTVQRILSKLEG